MGIAETIFIGLHLSWCQTTSGRQFWTVHRTPACAESCAEKIWNWRPLPVYPHGKRMA